MPQKKRWSLWDMKHSNIAFFIPHNGCPHCCSFCNQNTISGESKQVSPDEIVIACKKAMNEIKNPKNTQIAFFGGSFTAIDRGYMLSLLQAAKPFTEYFSGIRISTRPDAIDDEVLSILKEYNVTAIELGVQSLDDSVLSANERGHTAKDVYDAVKLIKKYGFSLGLQMMTGLYKDSKDTVIYTANEFVKIRPQTVRIYPTVVLRGTKLASLYEQGLYKSFSLEETVELCADLLELFNKNDISVIRLGLHASDNVNENKIAGVYHPAFRELCEARLYKRNITEVLKDKEKGDYTIFVPQKALSKAVGQRRSNIDDFAKIGYNITLREKTELIGYQVELSIKEQ